MTTEEFKLELHKKFPFVPTFDQERLLLAVSKFILSTKPRCALIIRGYAGTGKTTCVGAITAALPSVRFKSVLLAPTGRAAKVLSNYSNRSASTIHKKIYRRKSKITDTLAFDMSQNLHTNTVFIVDEASMIGRDVSVNFGEQRYLLDDLMDYVYSGDNCRLILIGDGAQLPPVGSVKSPALDTDYLRLEFDLTIARMELTQVVRQDKDSGILFNATRIREQIREDNNLFPKITVDNFDDVDNMTGMDVQEVLEDMYSQYGKENTMLITRSNKRANYFNGQIRARILDFEEEVNQGDFLMVVRNNYFWLEDDNPATDFIANGDIITVQRIHNYEDHFGLRFADATITMNDYPDLPEFDVKLLLETLYEESPSLPQEKNKKFYHDILSKYSDIKNRTKRNQAVKEDPYFNAIQVKFAYAVTCHKSQGGQWPVVLIDQGYLTEDMMGVEYLRWLYTAFTRASEKLVLLDFRKEFFEEKNE